MRRNPPRSIFRYIIHQTEFSLFFQPRSSGPIASRRSVGFTVDSAILAQFLSVTQQSVSTVFISVHALSAESVCKVGQQFWCFFVRQDVSQVAEVAQIV